MDQGVMIGVIVGVCAFVAIIVCPIITMCCRSNNEHGVAYCRKCKHKHGRLCKEKLKCVNCGHSEKSRCSCECSHILSIKRVEKNVERDEPYTEYYSEDETVPTSYITQEVEEEVEEPYEEVEWYSFMRPVEQTRQVSYTDYESQYQAPSYGSNYCQLVSVPVTKYRTEYYTEYVSDSATRSVTKYRTKKVLKMVQIPTDYVKKHVKKSRTLYRKISAIELVNEPVYCNCKHHETICWCNAPRRGCCFCLDRR